MQNSFFLVTVLASTLTLAISTGALAQTDPAALLEKLLEAIARGDVAGALALYADDAVWDGEPCVQRPRAWARPRSRRHLSAWRPTRRMSIRPSRTTCPAMS